jgi:hypothetical protein
LALLAEQEIDRVPWLVPMLTRHATCSQSLASADAKPLWILMPPLGWKAIVAELIWCLTGQLIGVVDGFCPG